MPSPEIALLLELVLDLKKDIGLIKDETSKNTITLDEHMRRTELAELRIKKLEERDQMMNGFVKISAGILGVVASLATIIEVIRLFH
jgi:hypothetical protein